MKHEVYMQTITSLLFFAITSTFMIFVNFVLRKEQAIIGIPVSPRKVHLILGPLIVLINSGLFVCLCALASSKLTPEQIFEIQSYQPKIPGGLGRLLRPLINPYYLGFNNFLNNISMAFLIVLWWLGMHSFVYSLELEKYSPVRFGWQSLITLLYLSLGLASMIAIQICWVQWGFDAYKSKWAFSFLGIAIGAFGLPAFLNLGFPKLF